MCDDDIPHDELTLYVASSEIAEGFGGWFNNYTPMSETWYILKSFLGVAVPRYQYIEDEQVVFLNEQQIMYLCNILKSFILPVLDTLPEGSRQILDRKVKIRMHDSKQLEMFTMHNLYLVAQKFIAEGKPLCVASARALRHIEALKAEEK